MDVSDNDPGKEMNEQKPEELSAQSAEAENTQEEQQAAQPEATAQQPEEQPQQVEAVSEQEPVEAQQQPAEAQQSAETQQETAETQQQETAEEQQAATAEAEQQQQQAEEQPGTGEQQTSEVPELTLGSGTAQDEPEVLPTGTIRGHVDKFGVAWGTGRRKTAVARVRIRDGQGLLYINGRRLEDYFKLEVHRNRIEGPLKATGFYGKVDVIVRVSGGGISGQAGAIALGIARALEAKQPTLHAALSDGGFLTRDDRMVERKKYGLKKARKRPQFSKR